MVYKSVLSFSVMGIFIPCLDAYEERCHKARYDDKIQDFGLDFLEMDNH